MILRTLMAFSSLSQKLLKPSQINYSIDVYRSVHLTVKDYIKEDEFKSYINKVMASQIENNKNSGVEQETNAVWVHINSKQFSLASYLCHIGFNIHHGLGQKLVLNKWIASKKDLITPYSAAFISAGAILIKDNRILLVQEKNGARKGDYGIPGGRSDFGETISSCAERQLLQQTNIQAKFNYILHFRELEKTAYGAMDYYFACIMDFQDSALDNIKLCDRQLSGYKWVQLAEYEEFSFKNSVGTQYQLAKYISNLYKQGFDFKKRKVNEVSWEKYKLGRDQVERLCVQHGLVEGAKILKAYQN